MIRRLDSSVCKGFAIFFSGVMVVHITLKKNVNGTLSKRLNGPKFLNPTSNCMLRATAGYRPLLNSRPQNVFSRLYYPYSYYSSNFASDFAGRSSTSSQADPILSSGGTNLKSGPCSSADQVLISKNPTQRSSFRPSIPASQVSCFRCLAHGHWAKSCT